jgi:hypothetical protein
MSTQPPQSDDPLAAMAKAAAKAVHTENESREAGLAAREASALRSRRVTRLISVVAGVAILAGALVWQVPRAIDPYYGDDPLADPGQARAYVVGLLDAVWEWRARHRGEFPTTLEQAVPEGRLPPSGSAYRLEYRLEGEVPVLTLQGGREPVVVRGAGK